MTERDEAPVTSDATKQDAPKNTIPPLSPAGKIVRRVLVWAAWLTPVVWGAAIVLGSVLDRQASNGLLRIVLLVGVMHLPMLMAGWIWYVAVFRLRASLLEMLLVLSAISVWPGLTLNDVQTSDFDDVIKTIIPVAFIFAASACGIGGGAVWGLSISQRTGEERTWPRLGYILLGCGMLVGMVATAPFGIAVIWMMVNCVHYWTGNTDWQKPLIMLVVTVPLVVAAAWGLIIERRCRQKYGPVNL